MAIEPMLAASAPPPAPSKSPLWAVALAACLPLGSCLVAPASLAVADGASSIPETLREGGFATYFVLLAFVIGVVVAAVSGALVARGTRVPAALPLFFAVLPWLIGDAGLRYNLRLVIDALSQVDPADKATLMAAGIGEATVNRHVGALFGSVLLGFVGLSFAVAALGQSSQKTPLGAVVGLAAGAPMLGAALFLPSLRESGAVGFLPVLPAICAVLGLAIAAYSAGPEAPHARSSALAATCTVPFGLAFAGAAVAAVLGQLWQSFRALAAVNPADRFTIATAAIAEMKPTAMLATWGWALAVVPVLAVGGWAVMRGAALKAPVGELAGAAVVFALVGAADFSAARATNDAVALVAVKPWAAVPGFQPAAFSGPAPRAEVGALVTPDRWVTVGGGGFDKPFDSPEKLVEALTPKALLQTESHRNDEGRMQKKPVRQFRRLALALDARLTSAQLKVLFDAATKAGAAQLDLVGQRRRSSDGSDSPYSPTAWMAKLLDAPGGVELRTSIEDLNNDVSSQIIEVGADGLLGKIEGSPQLIVLVPTDAATVQGVMAAAQAAADASASAAWSSTWRIPGVLRVLTGTDPALGHTYAQPEPGLAEALKGMFGEPDPAAARFTNREPSASPIGEGQPVVMGSLAVQVVRKVLHQHRGQYRYCYEKRLQEKPTLAGAVTLKFVISGAGKVVAAQIAQSTLNDGPVEECLVEKTRRLEFPKVPGGGVAIVTWPVTFKSTQ